MSRPLPGVDDLFGDAAGPASFCRVCGRALTNDVSRSLGIGPECRLGLIAERVLGRNEEETPMGPRSDFTVPEVVDGVICLEDEDKGGRSVTNDAEAVIEWLGENGYNLSLPVIYKDSMGYWSELRVTQGRFAGFVGLGKAITERAEAVRTILAKRDAMSGPTAIELKGWA